MTTMSHPGRRRSRTQVQNALRWLASGVLILFGAFAAVALASGKETRRAPYILISPTGQTGDPQPKVWVTFCDQFASLNDESWSVSVTGATVFKTFKYTPGESESMMMSMMMLPCQNSGEATGRLQLTPGVPAIITASIANEFDQMTTVVDTLLMPIDTIVPVASIAPGDSTLVNPSVNVVVTWTDNLGLSPSSREIRLNGTLVTNSFSYSIIGISTWSSSKDTVNLLGGTNVLTARICDTSNNCSVTDSVTYFFDGDPAPPPVIDLMAANAGDAVERSQCLLVNVGGGGASECGDLRLGHALPPTATFGKARQPTLTYSSAHAHPYVYVHADVTLPPATYVPDSVTAILTVNSVVRVPHAKWAGNQWTSNSTRRISLGFDALSDSTGVYDYSLEVTNWYGATPKPETETDRLVIVNRANSYFGAGWWLAGLERLYPSDMVWVGGDGSVRKYTEAATDVWVAESVVAPDTIKSDGSTYVRYLRGGIQVHFDANGYHTTTVPRLGLGSPAHRTVFTRTSGRLTKVTLPKPPSAATREYEFAYTSGSLTSVTAPPIGAIARVTTVSRSGAQITGITDPDSHGVSFGYDGSFANGINSRTDRRGMVTTFAYDSAHKVRQSSIAMGGGQSITTTLRSLEVQTRNQAAIDPVALYANVHGPRNVGDSTRYQINRFGAPSKIINALNDTTVMLRGDENFPALVTEVRHPNGFREVADYTARGNVAMRAQLEPYGQTGPDSAIMRYRYADTNWPDFVTSVVSPEGDSIAVAYDATTGNRIWQEDGRSASRVDFRYYSGGEWPGMMRAVDAPEVPPDSIVYNAHGGNVAATRSPRGFWSYAHKDAIGRDTLVMTPVDSIGALFQKGRTVYDIMGRDTLIQTIGPAMNGVNEQWLVVQQSFDPGGLALSVSRSGDGFVTIITGARYDAAGRKVADLAPDATPGTMLDNPKDSVVYDPAGNIVASIIRRDSLTTTMTYDVLNRLRTTARPQVYYGPLSAITGASHPAKIFSAEQDSFAYEPRSGRIAYAGGPDARTQRTYYPNGQVQQETQIIRTKSGSDWSKYVYEIGYEYDRNGRRTKLILPDQLVPRDSLWQRQAGTFGYMTFGYDSANGALTNIMDPMGLTFTAEYHARGLLAMVHRPVGPYTYISYDDDGNIRTWSAGYDDNFTLDAAGRVLQVYGPTASEFKYSGLGHVVFSRSYTPGGGGFYSADDSASYTHDALGNVLTVRKRQVVVDCTILTVGMPYFCPGNYGNHLWGGINNNYGTGVNAGRLISDRDSASWLNRTVYRYDASGNLETAGDSITNGNITKETRSYYDAQNRLRFTSRTIAPPCMPPADGCRLTITWEEYRYDALGRRVFVLTDRLSCPGTDYDGLCINTGRRTIWDGDRELGEIQRAAGGAQFESDTLPAMTATWPMTGTVTYTPGFGIDQPLSVIRTGYRDVTTGSVPAGGSFNAFAIMPLWNRQGMPTGAIYDNGSQLLCKAPPNHQSCIKVIWPEGFSILEHWRSNYTDSIMATFHFWYGSLLEDKKDASGLTYKRNRYYDPGSGRFTQEDPIGLAGGSNLNGYGNGDPINFSDPFGLAACDPDKDPDCVLVAQATAGVTIGLRGGVKAGDLVSVKWHLGATAEAGFVQTIDLNEGVIENGIATVTKLGAGARISIGSFGVGFTIGHDSESDGEGPVRLSSNPDNGGTFELAGMYPQGVGISGSLKVNPGGIATTFDSWIRKPHER